MQPIEVSQIEVLTGIINILSKNGVEKIDVGLMNVISKAATEVVDECARPRVFADHVMTPAEWLASDDVGLSSKYMLGVIEGKVFPCTEPAIPRDAADLGRCIRMLKSCGLEGEINKLKDSGSGWSMIVDNWRWLCDNYEMKNGEAIYDFLCSLD